MPEPQNILITGATGTLGRAIALSLAKAGRTIALHCHSGRERLGALTKSIAEANARAIALDGDLSNADGAVRLCAEASDVMGGIDLLVHCAACFEKTPLGEVTEKQWDQILDVDLKGAFFLAQELGMRMQRAGGKMIFLSDVAAVKPYAGYLPYCIAKAGLDAMIRGLAKSLAPRVLVNGIAPYVVTRPAGLSDRGWADLLSRMPAQRASTPEEIAAVVSMLAESGESITGQIIAVDGGRLLR